MPRLHPLALACLLLATTTSATGVHSGSGDDVAPRTLLESSRKLGRLVKTTEIDCVDGVKSIDLGCFKDDGRNRAFDVRDRKTQLNMTPESCASYCLGVGKFKYYALGWSRECWCGVAGTNVDKHGALPDSRCNKPCAGDSSRTCGGNWAFQAFQFAKSPPPPDYLGCFNDEGCDRIFSKKLTLTVTNSPKQCKKACGPDYKYYGLQYGRECWCGKADDVFDMYGPSKACAFRCTGDYKTTCGGADAMDVFIMNPDSEKGNKDA